MKNTQEHGAGISRTRRMVLTALLLTAALVLSLVEGALPPLPVPVPGVKLGLSNVAVMYALLFTGTGPALCIAVLKAGFVLFTRGSAAGALLSLCGGLLSVLGMALLARLGGGRFSVFVISMCGAVLHNVGQYIAISLLYTGISMLVYLPALLVAGIVAGAVTSGLLRLVMPALAGIAPHLSREKHKQ